MIHQLEILPKPPDIRPPDTPWPDWPRIMRTSSSHLEGCERRWLVGTKSFSGVGTRVSKLHGCEVEWVREPDSWKIKELSGTNFSLKVDLVILAMGFLHVVHEGLISKLGLKLDEKGNLAVNNYQTSQPEIFAAGDTIAGASLVARAIDSGRKAAEAVDRWLKTKK
jgi:NADPH-dependent glutamate synthase beta subunit-like oxidoreductase